MEHFESVSDYLESHDPANPVLCHRPHAAVRNARWFVRNFPGDVLYAVKANPHELMLNALYGAGVRHFDVASVGEAALVGHWPDVELYAMNPVKHPAHIREMYYRYGIRHFALDCAEELDKILRATGQAKDLGLHVRIAVDNNSSRVPLERKFGAHPDEVVELMVAARTHAAELGVCFHVGSQALNPLSYASAIARANQLIRRAGIIVESLDVGGGFPAAYPGIESQPLSAYLQVIDEAFWDMLAVENCRLRCEPGRALVADAAAMLVNVVLRKDQRLYINDGAYGSLFDAAHLQFPFPVRAYRNGEGLEDAANAPFGLYGPTCDSLDAIPGPYLLPTSIDTGDYIEFGQLGAYGDAMRTGFNGFGVRDEILVADAPLMQTLLDADEQAADVGSLLTEGKG